MNETEQPLDLLIVFGQKDMADMSDEELLQRIVKLQEMRKIRLTKTKRKDAMTKLLDGINVEKARIYLEVLK